ncbi:MAG: hypothetical protein ABIR50_08595, partial [Ginsengibacter sp.]
NWRINFLIVDTGNWLNSRKVLVSTKWITEVNWDNSVVVAKVTSEAVKNSPEYDESQNINETYENQLFDYYGMPQKKS